MFRKISQSNGPNSPTVAGFYDEASGSCQYVVIDEETRHAALIDIVQDFEPAEAATSFRSAQEILDFVKQEGLTVDWILDTHPHADHLMASAWLKEQLGAPTAIGEKIIEIAELWRKFYNLPHAFDPSADFNRLFADGEKFEIGNLEVSVMLSPGHTLGSVSYLVGKDAAFLHDTFMHVDAGTARTDFPGGSAAMLYQSLQEILALPDETRLFIGHDYGTKTRDEPAWESIVAEQKSQNPHLSRGIGEKEYVKLRTERDQTLKLPDRMLYALQVNLRGGRLPKAEDDGVNYFKIPANRNWR